MAEHPERYDVFALVAGNNWRLMAEQCQQWQPQHAVMACEEAARALRQALREQGLATEVHHGVEAMVQMAKHAEVDTVVAASVGAQGMYRSEERRGGRAG